MKVGVVGIAGGWSTERLIDAFEAQNAHSNLIDMSQVELDVSQGIALHKGEDLRSYDALVIKKIGSPYAPELLDRLATLRYLSATGLPIFSEPANIKRVLGRLSCTITLGVTQIPIPPTIITESVDRAVEAVNRFESAVFKPIYTSKARGMIVVEAGDDARDKIVEYQQRGNPVLYIQKFLKLPGSDLGIAFLGGECIGCYARVGNKDSWNTTTRSGGRYAAFEPSQDVIELARRAQAPFGLDFTCVDVALTDDGPVVFEVSAFGGFRGLLEAADVDAAKMIAQYVLGRLSDA